MFFELIAVFAAGLAGAGVALLLGHMTGGRLPRWMVPVAAGAAMIATAIANEYGWYGRQLALLPEKVEIVEEVESRALWRPWTYAFPFVDRFAAVDTESVQRHAAHPEQRLAAVYFFGRWAPTERAAVLADCAEGRRALLGPSAQFAENGSIEGVTWVSAPADDPILASLCGGTS
ncbi:hypothetical protein [Roseovarius aestuariivivens]|uniref:hypothetical protein n=1 Tax=Roseovarius aestuariivivens TaxID=1888910 RepID=UPI0010821F80|nr:hypothetical protein [Roseovarius aestuariivivens]